jgi:hypothetical protein
LSPDTAAPGGGRLGCLFGSLFLALVVFRDAFQEDLSWRPAFHASSLVRAFLVIALEIDLHVFLHFFLGLCGVLHVVYAGCETVRETPHSKPEAYRISLISLKIPVCEGIETRAIGY